MTALPVTEAYRIWAPVYDAQPNPLLALEERLLMSQLMFHPRQRVLDVATGTGRWLAHALDRRVNAVGVDISPEMLAKASLKRGLPGRLALGDLSDLPFADDSVDLTICSFALSYVEQPFKAFAEFARVARTLILSDMHPLAERSGWSRAFRVEGQSYRLRHFPHTLQEIALAAHHAGFRSCWSMEAPFGEPERTFFESEERAAWFASVRYTPAIYISSWERQ